MEKIIFENVGMSFGSKEIFKRCSLELKAGRVIGIVGRNGSGKSTFLKLAGKILKPSEGAVKFFDKKILAEPECKEKISAITPEMKVYEELTASENLKFFSGLRGRNYSEEELINLGSRVGLNLIELGRSLTKNFSTGTRQRLKFAVILSVDAEVWLLDEPTSNLDEGGRDFFHSEIRSAAQIGKLVLVATNDRSDLENCDEIIKLPID